MLFQLSEVTIFLPIVISKPLQNVKMPLYSYSSLCVTSTVSLAVTKCAKSDAPFTHIPNASEEIIVIKKMKNGFSTIEAIDGLLNERIPELINEKIK